MDLVYVHAHKFIMQKKKKRIKQVIRGGVCGSF